MKLVSGFNAKWSCNTLLKVVNDASQCDEMLQQHGSVSETKLLPVTVGCVIDCIVSDLSPDKCDSRSNARLQGLDTAKKAAWLENFMEMTGGMLKFKVPPEDAEHAVVANCTVWIAGWEAVCNGWEGKCCEENCTGKSVHERHPFRKTGSAVSHFCQCCHSTLLCTMLMPLLCCCFTDLCEIMPCGSC